MLLAYKEQPALEKRFSHLKTDFENSGLSQGDRRIQALLFIYFHLLFAKSLLKRGLVRRMDREDNESLTMYPRRPEMFSIRGLKAD